MQNMSRAGVFEMLVGVIRFHCSKLRLFFAMFSIPGKCMFPATDVLAVQVSPRETRGLRGWAIGVPFHKEFDVAVVFVPESYGTKAETRFVVSTHADEKDATQIAADVAKKFALDRVTDDLFLHRDQIRTVRLFTHCADGVPHFHCVEVHCLRGPTLEIVVSSTEEGNALFAVLAKGTTSLVDA